MVAVLITAAAGAEIMASSETLHELISFKTIGLNYGLMHHYVDEHYQLSAVAYVIGYGLLGLFLLPGSAIVVVLSGLLFGAAVGIPLAAIGSILAASLAFMMARLTLGRSLGRWTHPMFEALRAGFKRHALSYMMFLRLTPGLPFSAINIAPALLGVRFMTFLTGTAVGVLPSRIALSTAGAGLAKAITIENAQYSQCLAEPPLNGPSCTYNIHVTSLLTSETIAAFFALAIVALLPAILDAGPRVWRHVRGT